MRPTRFYTVLLAVGMAACSGKKEAEPDPFHVHRIDTGKDPHVMVLAGENPSTDDKASLLVGCNMPIMRAERQGEDGKSVIATLVDGRIYRQKTQAPVKTPLSEGEAYSEYIFAITSDMDSSKRSEDRGIIKKSDFDFANVCDVNKTPNENVVRGGVNGILLAPKGTPLLAFNH